MATIKWAVTTFGTFDFNDPANWQFGTVPGALDIAQFDQNFANIVTGDARIAELLVTQGLIDVTGSYTISGAQSTELAVSSGGAALFIEPGASISGTGNISVGSGSGLVVRGTLSGGSATFTNAQFTLQPGSIFDVGTVNLGSGDIIHGSSNGFTVTNAIQIAGSISATGTELLVAGTISGPGSLAVDGPVELDGSNTYSGGTSLSGVGLLAVGNANALGTGGLSINGGELLATTTEQMLVHLGTVHIPIYVGVLCVVLTTAWALIDQARRPPIGAACGGVN